MTKPVILYDNYGLPIDLAAAREERQDAWANPQTGIGVWGADKTKAASYLPVWRVLDQELTSLMNGSDIARKIVSKRPEEMFRRGFDIEAKGISESEKDDVLEFATEYLDLSTNMREAKRWGRLYGGALLLMGIDDGRMPWEPLDEDNIRDFYSLSLVDRRYSYVQSQYAAMGQSSQYGRAQIYLISNAVAGYGWDAYGAETITKKSQQKLMQEGAQTALVHESRVLRFDGNPADVVTRQNLAGWSWSVLQVVYDAMRQFDGSFDSAAYLLSDASQGVFKLQGLLKAISSGQRGALAMRLQMLEQSRSVMHGIALDAGSKDGQPTEDFTRVTTPFGGIPDLLDKMMLRMASAADMPATELFGRAPAGMNATGESDVRKWYDTIQTEQTNELGPQLKRVFRLLAKAKKGPLRKNGVKWTINFNPLWSPTDAELATTRFQNAQRDQIYVTIHAVTPEEVAIDLAEVYPRLDMKGREAALEAGIPYNPYPKAPLPVASPMSGGPVMGGPDGARQKPEPEPPTPPPPPPAAQHFHIGSAAASTSVESNTEGEPLSKDTPLPLMGTSGTQISGGNLPAVAAAKKAGAGDAPDAPTASERDEAQKTPMAKGAESTGARDKDGAIKKGEGKPIEPAPGTDKEKADGGDIAAQAYQTTARRAARASQAADDGDASDGLAAAAHYSARAFARKAGDQAAVDLHTTKIAEHEARETEEHADAWDPDQARDESGRFTTSGAVSASREATSRSGVASIFGGADDHAHAAAGHSEAAAKLKALSERHASLGNAKASDRYAKMAADHESQAASHTAEAAKLAPPPKPAKGPSVAKAPKEPKKLDPRRQAAGRKAAETRGQNDERALQNIPDHLHPLWHEMKSTIKGSPHERAEKLTQYAEANPHEAIGAMERSSERKLSEMLSRRRAVGDAADDLDAQDTTMIQALSAEPTVQPDTPRATIVVIWNAAGEILCVSRPEAPHEMALPGGSIDPQETRRHAGIRESFEELGIRVLELRFNGYLASPIDGRTVYVYTAGRWAGVPRAKEAGTSIAWLTPEALMAQSVLMRPALEDLLERGTLARPRAPGGATPSRPKGSTNNGESTLATTSTEAVETALNQDADDDAAALRALPTLMAWRMDGKAAGEVFRLLLDDYPADHLGWIMSGHWSGPREIPLDRIDFSNRDTWRASHESIDPYAERIQDGKRKPVVLVKTPGNPKYIIVDGHHRTLAHEKLGMPVLAYTATVHMNNGPWDELHAAQKKGSSKDQKNPSHASIPGLDTSSIPRQDMMPDPDRTRDWYDPRFVDETSASKASEEAYQAGADAKDKLAHAEAAKLHAAAARAHREQAAHHEALGHGEICEKHEAKAVEHDEEAARQNQLAADPSTQTIADAHDPDATRTEAGTWSEVEATQTSKSARAATAGATDPGKHMLAAKAHGLAARAHRFRAQRHAELGNVRASGKHTAQALEHDQAATEHHRQATISGLAPPDPNAEPPRADGEWNEEDHPRDESGRFGAGSGDKLFKPDRIATLPTKSAQGTTSKAEIVAQAKDAHEHQLDLLDRGTGLDKDLGVTAIRGDLMDTGFGDKVSEAARQPGPVVAIGPMKTEESIERKTRDENGGHYERLTDVVRASVAVDRIDQLHAVIGHLEDRGLKLAQQPNDRFQKPMESGYRDINLKVSYPNGHIGELQLHVKPMIEAKSAGHKLYDVTRALAPKIADRSMTRSDWHKYDTAMRAQQTLYGAAWKKAGGK